jgi:hypothetical protein
MKVAPQCSAECVVVPFPMVRKGAFGVLTPEQRRDIERALDSLSGCNLEDNELYSAWRRASGAMNI